MPEYEKPAFCAEDCVKFDAAFIAEICKIADEALKVRCGIEDWAAGTSRCVVMGSDGNFYLANNDGDPANNDPVGGDGTHWHGAFCSVAAMIEFIWCPPSTLDCCAELESNLISLSAGTLSVSGNTFVTV